jgi:hypothetical protein
MSSPFPMQPPPLVLVPEVEIPPSSLRLHASLLYVLPLPLPSLHAKNLSPSQIHIARYLASKLWRGETYFLQIDSHSHFKQGWDSNLIEQIKQTPSYPHSVISNYPPSYSAKGVSKWREKGVPSGLCTTHFTDNDVLRLEMTPRNFPNAVTNDAYTVPEPKHTLFVAAGFFFARSEFLIDVPFDPFLPFLFMGEEIIMSTRMWTAGWDIFGPSQDVLKHGTCTSCIFSGFQRTYDILTA